MGRFRDVFGIGPKPKNEDEISAEDARMGVTARTTMRRSDYIVPQSAPEKPKTQLTPNGLPEGMVTFSAAAQLLGVRTEDIFSLVQTGRLRAVPREELRGVSVFLRMSGVLRRADLIGLGPLQQPQA